MTPADAALFATQLAMGFALAACVGLRTFLPLLAAGLLAHFGYVTMGASFEWMASTPALIVFGSAVVFEVMADKVPGLDHALHAVEAFVKPVAATLLAASLFTNLDPLMAMTLGLVGGGAIAGTVHVARGAARLISTGTTGGFGNPLLSFVDDGLAVFGIVFAFLVPILAALVVLIVTIMGVRFFRQRRRKSGAEPVGG